MRGGAHVAGKDQCCLAEEKEENHEDGQGIPGSPVPGLTGEQRNRLSVLWRMHTVIGETASGISVDCGFSASMQRCGTKA